MSNGFTLVYKANKIRRSYGTSYSTIICIYIKVAISLIFEDQGVMVSVDKYGSISLVQIRFHKEKEMLDYQQLILTSSTTWIPYPKDGYFTIDIVIVFMNQPTNTEYPRR